MLAACVCIELTPIALRQSSTVREWVRVRSGLLGWARRPRPRLRDTSINLREVMLVLILGPGLLTGSLSGVVGGHLSPDLALLIVSTAITAWGAAWALRPTEVHRASRREIHEELGRDAE